MHMHMLFLLSIWVLGARSIIHISIHPSSHQTQLYILICGIRFVVNPYLQFSRLQANLLSTRLCIADTL